VKRQSKRTERFDISMTFFEIPVNLTSEVITLLIAAYGAVLSTYLLLFRIRPKLKVTMSTSIPFYGQHVGPLYFSIKAVNVRNTPVTVTAAYILLPKKHVRSEQSRVFVDGDGDVSFPYVLESGRSCTVTFGHKRLAQALTDNYSRIHFSLQENPKDDALYAGKIKIRGGFASATDKMYRSKKIGFDIDSAQRSDE
jgi:hypothetical protein